MTMEEDSKYFDILAPERKSTIKAILAKMQQQGLKNPHLQAGILAVISQKNNFTLQEEASYGNRSAAELRILFSAALARKTNSEIDALKQDDKVFLDAVYAGKYGNSVSEGYKYRGRGFGQLTFKGNYQRYGEMIQMNLVEHPDLVNSLPVAAAVLVAFFIDQLRRAPKLQQEAYHFTDANDFMDATDAANAAFNALAGWSQSPRECAEMHVEELHTIHARVNGFLKLLQVNAG
jgi:predicted chitinase